MKFFSVILAAAVATLASADCAPLNGGCTVNGLNCCSGMHCLHAPGPGGAPTYKCVKN